MKERVQVDVINLNPKACLFMGRTNDIRQRVTDLKELSEVDEIVEFVFTNYVQIVKTLITNEIVVPPCLIIRNSEDGYNYEVMNLVIDKVNEKLLQVSKELDIEFINYNEVLCNHVGILSRDLSDDGLHPNAYGYLAMFELLKVNNIIN